MARFDASDLDVQLKADASHVTEADLATERAIRAILEVERPDDGVFGEEFGVTGDAARQWIIDPIDGTANYLKGIPMWTTLIALVDRRRPARRRRQPARARPALVGGDRPRRVDEHAGRRRRSGSPSHPSTRSPTRASSFQSIRQWDEVGQLDALVRLSRAVWRDRGYGDTWPYMLLAEGRLEFVAEFGVKEYDVAALVPIITEAGGRFTSFDGTDSIAERSVARDQRHPALRLPRPPASPTPDPRRPLDDTPPVRSRRRPVLLAATMLARYRLRERVRRPPIGPPGSDAGPTLARRRRRVEPTERRPAADPTCETIISGSDRRRLRERRLDGRAEPFRVGEIEIPEGMQCVWGDFSTATDHVQIFGWAPISEEMPPTRRTHLVEVGWHARRIPPTASIVTESPETTVATDDEGYGLTYLFGDGWVKYADTKQGLLLVVWPPA